MRTRVISRRSLLETGVCALAAVAAVPGTAAALQETGLSEKSENVVRRYYAAWEGKDWRPMDSLLAADFRFTSPVDDHISKSAFKAGCWDTQNTLIERLDLKHVIGAGNDAFVMYVGRTTNGKTFRNVEYLRLRDEKLVAVECYFGAKDNFPSAVSGR